MFKTNGIQTAGAIFLPLLLGISLQGDSAIQEEGVGWPRQIDAPQATVIVYQPQVESFAGQELAARAAVSVTRQGATEPAFGAIWVVAQVDTDRDERLVTVRSVEVTNVRFPNATEEDESRLSALLEAEIPNWDLSISLDRLLTSLEDAERERESMNGVAVDPPDVVFSPVPTVLVSIDGEPRLQEVDGSSVKRVINTPFTILLSSESRYYLFAGEERWYESAELTSGWALATQVPSEVAELAPEVEAELEADSAAAEPGPPPAIMVVTEPTELIVSDGDPEWVPITGTELLYMSNTESDVLLEIGSQQHYIVLSGRWYAAGSINGPWTHVSPADLPESFSDIPPASEMGHLLVSVPGTEAAKEAVLDNQIPQTAAISRSEASLDVTYDGDPQFEPIEETEMEYAVNTSYQVIHVDDAYYACHEAAWFVAQSPTGPWMVADMVPAEIQTIPPSVPVHNVKYVYIYDTTPDVVYVGYTPGYTYSYVYGGTIVYGTGYYYSPWYGSVYYPRPATWGWHVRWNPWYGWSYGFSYSTGPFTFHVGVGGWHGGGWWGPVGYRGYHHGYHRGWHAGYRAGARAGYRAGYRAGTRNARYNNIYNRPQNRGRNVSRPAVGNQRRAATPVNRPNNVFTDRNGNVHRRTQNGWQQRGSTGWQTSGRGNVQGRQQPNLSQLDRSHQSRQRGTVRTDNFQRSRSGGARRGGRSRG
jgi:hypothetical protein